MTPGVLVRVVAPHFCAGLIFGPDGRCVEAAPILRYCLGRSATWAKGYFTRKGWEAQRV